MEVSRAKYTFKAEAFSPHKDIKPRHKRLEDYNVSTSLFLLRFNKDHKHFWRQGKPVNIKEGAVLILNSVDTEIDREGSCFNVFKIPAKNLACYINQKLPISSKALLPLEIDEWPEILVDKESLLAQSLEHVSKDFFRGHHYQFKPLEICEILDGFFQSVDLVLFKAMERLSSLKPSSRQELVQKVATVNQYMHQNLTEDLSLEMLSEVVGYSHFYFQRQYKLAMGISPTKNLSFLRLKKAQELILNTNYRLKEISDRVGYNDLPTFSKAFKRQFGECPCQIRGK